MFNRSLSEWKKILISFTAVAFLKLYFRGSSCPIHRDLTGRVAVLTGGNTGIGKETLLDLARNNCSVIMGARDRSKSE